MAESTIVFERINMVRFEKDNLSSPFFLILDGFSRINNVKSIEGKDY